MHLEANLNLTLYMSRSIQAHYLIKIGRPRNPKAIGPLIMENKVFKGFYHIWSWRPSWSCDQDHLNKVSFPILTNIQLKCVFNLPSGFGGDEVLFENVDVWTTELLVYY